MLYASCRANVVTTAQRECGLQIEKKVCLLKSKPPGTDTTLTIIQLEAALPTEIGEDHLMEEFHPQREEKKAFQRPKRPGRR